MGIISRTMTSAKIRRLYLELPSQFPSNHWVSVNTFSLSDKPNIYTAERKQIYMQIMIPVKNMKNL